MCIQYTALCKQYSIFNWTSIPLLDNILHYKLYQIIIIYIYIKVKSIYAKSIKSDCTSVFQLILSRISDHDHTPAPFSHCPFPLVKQQKARAHELLLFKNNLFLHCLCFLPTSFPYSLRGIKFCHLSCMFSLGKSTEAKN